MKTKTILLIVTFILLAMLVSCGAGYYTDLQEKTELSQPGRTGNAKYSSNWDWISIDDESTVCYKDIINEDDKELISLGILSWEQENPNREIIDIDILIQPGNASKCGDILGVSVYSRIRE